MILALELNQERNLVGSVKKRRGKITEDQCRRCLSPGRKRKHWAQMGRVHGEIEIGVTVRI